MDELDDEHIDMAELEANLYAQIHHDAPETVQQMTTVEHEKKSQQQYRIVTNNSIINNNEASTTSNNRYFIDAGGGGGGQKKTKAKSRGVNPFSVAGVAAVVAAAVNNPDKPSPQPIIQSDYRPKPFTPYTSYLSQTDYTSVNAPETCTNAPSQSLRANKSKKNKSKKNKGLNPFNRLRVHKKTQVEELKVKQERAGKSRAQLETVNLDSSEPDDEDDDVICIPTPAPPLVCIDSSDDEPNAEEPNGSSENSVIPEDFIGQRDRSRISQSRDEDAFEGLDDDELELICSASGSALVNAAAWKPSDSLEMDKISLDKGVEVEHETTLATSGSNEQLNVFATPNPSKYSNQTYEVEENGFSAVDVYESESSDFPESVYAKGILKPSFRPPSQKQSASDSETSDIQVNIQNRSKRLMKRKSSGSNKGSDYMTCSDNDDSDTAAYVNIVNATSTPVVKKGEAISNVKHDSRRKSKRHRSVVSPIEPQRSDEEFYSMLSCIVHNNGKTSAKDHDVPTLSQSASDKVVDAREIAERSLNKPSKEHEPSLDLEENNQPNWIVTDEVLASDHETDDETKESDTEMLPQLQVTEGHELAGKSLTWIVKDQVGETDDGDADMEEITLNIGIVGSNVAETHDGEKRKKEQRDSSASEAPPISVPKVRVDKSDEKRVRSCSLVVDDPEIGWNDEMKRFYNHSWGGEGHDTKAIQRQMTSDPYKWSIMDEDYHIFHNKHRLLRCLNCRELGHKTQNCFQPPKEIKCHMCGNVGHREPRCPYTLCLRCGSRTQIFSRGCQRCNSMVNKVCSMCNVRGHGIRDCPDKWRRYHTTIKPNVPLQVRPLDVRKPRSCCICSGYGHLAEHCHHALRILDTPASSFKIQSYADCYTPLASIANVQDEESAPFALISVPIEKFRFNWDVNEDPDRFYGRVIKEAKINTTGRSKRALRQRGNRSIEESSQASIQNTIDITVGEAIMEQPKEISVKQVMTKLNEPVHMVLNPLCGLNKKKKQFSKQFYEELKSVVVPVETDECVITGEQHAPPLYVEPDVVNVTNKIAANLDAAFEQILDVDVITHVVDQHSIDYEQKQIDIEYEKAQAEADEVIKMLFEQQEDILLPEKTSTSNSKPSSQMLKANKENSEFTGIIAESPEKEESIAKLRQFSFMFTMNKINRKNEELNYVPSYDFTFLMPGESSEEMNSVSLDEDQKMDQPIKSIENVHALNAIQCKNSQSNNNHQPIVSKSSTVTDAKSISQTSTQNIQVITDVPNVPVLNQTRLGCRELFIREITVVPLAPKTSTAPPRNIPTLVPTPLQKSKPIPPSKRMYVPPPASQRRPTLIPIPEQVPKPVPPPPELIITVPPPNSSSILAQIEILEKNQRFLNNLQDDLGKKASGSEMKVSSDNNQTSAYHVELKEDPAKQNLTHDSDSNYSFSEYFHDQDDPKTAADKGKRITFDNAAQMPDFIPLDGGGEYSPSAAWADGDQEQNDDAEMDAPPPPTFHDDDVVKSDAKIYLTKEHSNFLLTKRGAAFLQEAFHRHNVVVRMEWRSVGNLLVVTGTNRGQDKFHADLIEYCTNYADEIQKKKEISQQVPKNRLPLIRFIREQIIQLDKSLGNVKELYTRMRMNERQNSKTGTRNADRARRTLNMVLMGQTGLRDGNIHLIALQSILRSLLDNKSQDVISNTCRHEVMHHFRYIFTAFKHDHYEQLINEYNILKRNKQLPLLNLDRKLFGLKIDLTNCDVVEPEATVKDVVQENQPLVAILAQAKQKLLSTTDKTIESLNPRVNPFSKPNIKHDTLQSGTVSPAKPIIDLTDAVKRFKKEDTIPAMSEASTLTGRPKAGPNWEVNCVKILEHISMTPTPHINDQRKVEAQPSKLWSIKCDEFIEKCRRSAVMKNNPNAMDKWDKVSAKAKAGKLSYNDYQSLVRMHNMLKKQYQNR